MRPAVVAGAGAQVDDPVGVGHHGLVVLDHDHRLARVHQPIQQSQQVLDVRQVQARGRHVEPIDAAADNDMAAVGCGKPSIYGRGGAELRTAVAHSILGLKRR
jgi:hypothetical protein